MDFINDDLVETGEQGEQIEPVEAMSPARQRRSIIFHLMYALEAHEYDSSLASIIDTFNRGFEQSIEPHGEEYQIVTAVTEKRQEVDEFLKPLLANWRLERIGVCTRLILRLATWELLYTNIEPLVIINEAIELAKCFAERDAYRFVNGVLDEALKRLGKAVVQEPKPETPAE
jgi:transcription antitermination factor NusB